MNLPRLMFVVAAIVLLLVILVLPNDASSGSNNIFERVDAVGSDIRSYNMKDNVRCYTYDRGIDCIQLSK